MWKKIKIIFISIGIFVLLILSFIFGSRSNGRRVSDPDELNRDIEEGFGNLQDGLEGTQGAIDGVSSDLGQRVEEIDQITTGLGATEGKLQRAMEILRAAKERSAVN